MQHPAPPGRIAVMGVAGSGKTTIGSGLAARLGLPYADADDFHPVANLAKMSAGRPLDDADRQPWLHAVGAWLADHPAGVVGCSALRRKYRDVLRSYAPDLRFVHLTGASEVVTARVAARSEHFMPASLVGSQLDTLEPLGSDEDGFEADLTLPVDELLERLSGAFGPVLCAGAR
jgi:gluconokinase